MAKAKTTKPKRTKGGRTLKHPDKVHYLMIQSKDDLAIISKALRTAKASTFKDEDQALRARVLLSRLKRRGF